MKHFFITLYLLGISLFSSAQQEEKAALLITHYGSSDPQTRALTLDVVTREAQEAFPHNSHIMLKLTQMRTHHIRTTKPSRHTPTTSQPPRQLTTQHRPRIHQTRAL
jgi:hypothetical protein